MVGDPGAARPPGREQHLDGGLGRPDPAGAVAGRRLPRGRRSSSPTRPSCAGCSGRWSRWPSAQLAAPFAPLPWRPYLGWVWTFGTFASPFALAATFSTTSVPARAFFLLIALLPFARGVDEGKAFLYGYVAVAGLTVLAIRASRLGALLAGLSIAVGLIAVIVFGDEALLRPLELLLNKERSQMSYGGATGRGAAGARGLLDLAGGAAARGRAGQQLHLHAAALADRHAAQPVPEHPGRVRHRRPGGVAGVPGRRLADRAAHLPRARPIRCTAASRSAGSGCSPGWSPAG